MVNKANIEEVLKEVMDPELGFDVITLGLIYDIKIENEKATIVMTLTTPHCPYGPELMNNVKRHVVSLEGIKDCEIELTFSPVWSPDKMTEEARIALGL